MNQMLWHYDDISFKQIVRMNKESFVQLFLLIHEHPVFHTEHRKPQTAVWIQLMVVLQRLGCNGNANSLGARSRYAGVGSGTVAKFTDRVFTAILAMKDQVIYWPNEEERRDISARMGFKHGLPGCVGILDGTPVNFSQRPAIDGETFFNRKSRYCYNVQLICDDMKRIRFYQIGWPGSVYDSTVFGHSSIALNPEQYFSLNEFLIADSGYALTEYCCVPYRLPYASEPYNQVFNILFSSARVIIEHVNGIVKGRFASLKSLPTQIKEKKDFEICNKWILVSLILHNLLIDFNEDEWEHQIETEEAINDLEANFVNITNHATGKQLREKIQEKNVRWGMNNNA
jgi:hypothetical protein